MSTPVSLLHRVPLPPLVHFIEGKPAVFIDHDEGGWRRASLEQDAYLRTGFTRETCESHVGVYVRKRQNGRGNASKSHPAPHSFLRGTYLLRAGNDARER